MKKCLALLLVLLSLLSAASAEAPARANNAAVQAMLEATLANGAGIRKDPLAMLENAWRNGFDYFEVSYWEKEYKEFTIKVAIQGFDSAVTSIVNGGGTPSDSTAPEGRAAYSEEAAQLLETLEAALLAQCRSISEMLAMVGWGDAAFLYELIDDTRYFNYGDTALLCSSVFYYDGRAVVHTKWELPDQQEEP